MKISEMMSKNIVTIDFEVDALAAVRTMMKHKIRHLPVIKAGQVMGILSVDQLQSLKGSFEKVTVGEICNRFVVYAAPDTDVEVASSVFNQFKLQALPVLNKWGNIVGIVTSMDFVKSFNTLMHNLGGGQLHPPLQA